MKYKTYNTFTGNYETVEISDELFAEIGAMDAEENHDKIMYSKCIEKCKEKRYVVENDPNDYIEELIDGVKAGNIKVDLFRMAEKYPQFKAKILEYADKMNHDAKRELFEEIEAVPELTYIEDAKVVRARRVKFTPTEYEVEVKVNEKTKEITIKRKVISERPKFTKIDPDGAEFNYRFTSDEQFRIDYFRNKRVRDNSRFSIGESCVSADEKSAYEEYRKLARERDEAYQDFCIAVENDELTKEYWEKLYYSKKLAAIKAFEKFEYIQETGGVFVYDCQTSHDIPRYEQLEENEMGDKMLNYAEHYRESPQESYAAKTWTPAQKFMKAKASSARRDGMRLAPHKYIISDDGQKVIKTQYYSKEIWEQAEKRLAKRREMPVIKTTGIELEKTYKKPDEKFIREVKLGNSKGFNERKWGEMEEVRRIRIKYIELKSKKARKEKYDIWEMIVLREQIKDMLKK